MAGKKGFGFVLSLDIKDFQKNAKAAEKAITSLAPNLASISKTLSVSVAGAFAAAAGAAYKFGEELDGVMTALQSTWKDAETTSKKYKDLRDIMEGSGFGMKALIDADKALAAMGASANDATLIIRRLGDVATALGGGDAEITKMADALLKMQQTGKVTASQLEIFARAGLKVEDLIGGNAADAVNTLIDRMQTLDGVMAGEATDLWTQVPRLWEIGTSVMGELGNVINDVAGPAFTELVNKAAALRDEFVSLIKSPGGAERLLSLLKEIGEAVAITALPAFATLAPTLALTAVKGAAVAASFIAIAEAVHDFNSGQNNLLKAVGGVFDLAIEGLNVLWLNTKAWIADIVAGFSEVMAMGGAAPEEVVKKAADDRIIANKAAVAAKKAGTNYDRLAGEAFDIIDDSITAFAENSLSKKFIEEITALGERLSDSKAGAPDLSGRGRIGRIKSAAAAGGGSDVDKQASNSIWKSFGSPLMDAMNGGLKKLKEFLPEIKEEMDPIQEWFDDLKTNAIEGTVDAMTDALFSGKNILKEMGSALSDLGKEILREITRMMMMTALMRALGIKSSAAADMGFTTISSFKGLSINDGIITKNGQVIKTAPDDYIMATKDPSSLGGRGVVVNVHNSTAASVEATEGTSIDGNTFVDVWIDAYQHNRRGLRTIVSGR